MRTKNSKNSLRQKILARLEQMPAAKRAASSARACSLLKQQGLWRSANSILFFAPMPEELDVWPLVAEALAAGKTVALPCYDSKSKQYAAARVQDLARDIKPGHFGIREPADHCVPVALGSLDLVLVPGVAFDPLGRRLGRGKGYYDQLLPHVRGTTCGVAFEEQFVAEVPVEAHDRRVNCVLTPTRWIEAP
jgi:5-formyltetrahydrofolate cyclo-ligase